MLIYTINSENINLISSLTELNDNIAVIAEVIGIITGLSYYIFVPIFIFKGQTIGKKITKLRIVNINDSQDIKFISLIKREFIGVMIIEGGLVCTSNYLREIIQI